ATSAARAVLAVMEAEDAPARAAAAGDRLAERLRKLAGVVEVRGRGLIVGVELPADRPAADVAAAALARGLLVNPVQPTTLRLLPSLLVTDGEVDEAVAILADVLLAGPGGRPQQALIGTPPKEAGL
ncbi:MAG: aminotransferase class III-fold pyridoxal phosphate-dependent enzyme, partial [Acidimicrobiales bacterium]